MRSERRTFVDGHVHIYRCFRAGRGLDAAVASFRSFRDGRGGMDDAPCLVVVDPRGVDGFGRLARDGAAGWSVSRCDPLALRAVRDRDRATLLLLAGRQVRTERGLEVLAYFTRDRIDDGLPLPRAVDAVLDAGGVPVVPWGFGKWWGRRGRAIEDLIASSIGRRLLIADSAVRPQGMPEPRAFDVARDHGVPIVAGSDPLPFSGEEQKIGRYGFFVEGGLERDDPSASLKSRLVEPGFQCEIHGRRENVLAAAGLQIGMQVRSWLSARSGSASPAARGDR